MLNSIKYQRNANQNHNEVSLHTIQNGYHQSLQITNAGESVEKMEPSFTKVGKKIGAATMENSMEVLKK